MLASECNEARLPICVGTFGFLTDRSTNVYVPTCYGIELGNKVDSNVKASPTTTDTERLR